NKRRVGHDLDGPLVVGNRSVKISKRRVRARRSGKRAIVIRKSDESLVIILKSRRVMTRQEFDFTDLPSNPRDGLAPRRGRCKREAARGGQATHCFVGAPVQKR